MLKYIESGSEVSNQENIFDDHKLPVVLKHAGRVRNCKVVPSGQVGEAVGIRVGCVVGAEVGEVDGGVLGALVLGLSVGESVGEGLGSEGEGLFFF